MTARFRRRLVVPRTYVEMVRHAGIRRVDRQAQALRTLVAESMILSTPLPDARRMRCSIWGVALVRDELDVIEATVRHQLEQGMDAVLVADNRSVDGTGDVLRHLARELPVYVVEDRLDAYYQEVKANHLAHMARRAGARWIVPFDADELWFAEGSSVGRFLRDVDLTVVAAPVHNIFPFDFERREGTTLSAHEEWRFDLTPVGRHKVAYRSHPWATLTVGAHNVRRGGRRGQGLAVVHVPWRSRSQLCRKLRRGKSAIEETSLDQSESRHYRALGGASETTMDDVWRAIVEGRHVDDLYWAPIGPFRKEAPLSWSTWRGPKLAGSPVP